MAFHSLETGNIVITQTTRGRRRAVDVHMHFIPEFYRDALASANMTSPDGINALPPWDDEDFLRVIDSLHIETSMLSSSSPGVHLGNDKKALQLARKVNDEGRRLMDRYQQSVLLALEDVENALVSYARSQDRDASPAFVSRMELRSDWTCWMRRGRNCGTRMLMRKATPAARSPLSSCTSRWPEDGRNVLLSRQENRTP
jgi:hypothetical protein